MMRFSLEMKLDRVFSSVVLPEPVPPLMTIFRRAFMAPSRNMTISGVNAPNLRRSSRVSGLEPKRRIVSDGPSSASGGMIAFNREPSGSRASTIGDVSSTRRPTRETIRSRICSKWSLSRNVTSDLIMRPFFSRKTFFGPLIMMSATPSSFSRSSSGPKPKASSRTSSTSRSRSDRLRSGFSVSQRCSTTTRISRRSESPSSSEMRVKSSFSTSFP